MKAAIAAKINYLVGGMMLEFVRRLGPIPLDEEPSDKLSEAYYYMEEKRKEISETLLDYIDASEEQKIMEDCK